MLYPLFSNIHMFTYMHTFYFGFKLKLQFFTEISNRNRIFSGLLLRVFIVLMEVITKRSMADFGGHITHFWSYWFLLCCDKMYNFLLLCFEFHLYLQQWRHVWNTWFVMEDLIELPFAFFLSFVCCHRCSLYALFRTDRCQSSSKIRSRCMPLV